MDQVTQIDVPELIRIGDAVRDVSVRLDRTTDEMRGWEYAAPHAVEGAIMCGTGLAHAVRGWEATLGSLAREVRAFGDGLRQSASDYREADAFAAERLRASGHPAVAPGRSGL
ncbi:hypothetical protein ACWKSP_03435 [Micromonosporaceae bacterium Da 78-11]